ncbi:hypothetical protein ACGFW5_20360 [Streptomyces sp. NPDC048416]
MESGLTLAAVNSHPTNVPSWGVALFVGVFILAAIFVVVQLVRRRDR